MASPSNLRSSFLALAAVAAVALVGSSAWAEFPQKEVTVIVNYGAGGATDLSTRVLAEAAEKILGQPLRVENRAGGSGTVGPTFVANGKNDGYTIGVASFIPMAVVPHLQPVPYDLDSFRFIVGHARYRVGLAVRTDSPYQTIEELIAAAKSGADITYTSTSSQSSVLMTRFTRASGAKFKAITYKSGQESAIATLGGHVELLVENPTNITPHVKSGQMRLLASASSVRWYELPDVPTLIELGYDVSSESYAGLAAPAGTPDDVVEKLENAFAQAINDPKVQKTLRDLGMEPVYFTSAEYRKLLEDGYEAMATDLVEIGLKKE